jgi:hypothetical protein
VDWVNGQNYRRPDKLLKKEEVEKPYLDLQMTDIQYCLSPPFKIL